MDKYGRFQRYIHFFLPKDRIHFLDINARVPEYKHTLEQESSILQEHITFEDGSASLSELFPFS
jgi:hypothetical protein